MDWYHNYLVAEASGQLNEYLEVFYLKEKAKIAEQYWNHYADEYNQWSELGQDEKDALIAQVKL